ncbi:MULTISPECIES: dTMP kinase [unclassified Mycoplasma]|uniref:dTMP kinase n=1 Tax=unclassified Mycoplasma TaxID=2683645 RepID=UPI00216B09B8|nr:MULTISPECIES: dTMP kinase [unclassified Mycoplasma]MCS4536732.1 dTMP kinase [Mycoplasma sp. CSL7475-4]MCT4469732.1 dTMP kinase [Mycoplasma sp. HS2188]
MFITFEGPDASGKTTLINKLAEYLNKNYPQLKFITTREPGGKDIVEAEKIREIILDKNSKLSSVSEALLYTTSRRIHLERVIWPALKENKIVICDRYVDSFFAYQGYARELGIEYTKTLTNLVIENTIPDITFFLDITPSQSKERMNNLRLVNQQDRLDDENDAFHNNVYNGYRALIDSDPSRFIILNADQPVDIVFNELITKLNNDKRFKKYIIEVMNDRS